MPDLDKETCPDCGGSVRFYHASYKFGDGISRIVCAKKCQGWKIIKEYQRQIGEPYTEIPVDVCLRHACNHIQERLDRIETVWQKYNHMDEVICDYKLVEGFGIRGQILYDLWQAIRREE